ncbi:N-acetyltransferase [Arthrobacter sp. TS-15]|uniref:GNAT family N-acetyltransferase n=1 Tax=Arthrobacter sp. TS-15 TaxID=2510797 RepID=UPI00115F3587|nr:GNAT family N-acetyltransferase [Arthrobacter sp. TS-15]TQS88574.1 N-acetyltransferase [Arthrobacter sp. TS-15]
MDIRRANRGDQVAIGNLIFDWDQDNGQRYQDGRGRVSEREFVAEDAEGIVGWISGQHGSGAWANLAAFEDQPDYWACSFIVKLFVRWERQSGGIGGLLLDAFEMDAQEAGRDLVVVHPDETGDKERLRNFYRDHGYVLMDPSSDHSRTPPWLMAKSLPVLL